MPSLVLRLLGVLVFLATALTLAVASLMLVYALATRDVRLLRRVLTGAAVVAGAYALALFGGPLVARERTVAPGAEVSFCGFDCHLHVSVVRVARPGPLEIEVQFRSDAKAAPEFPARLAVRVEDSAGRRYEPIEGVGDAPLAAGETRRHAFRFDVPPAAGPVRLLVTWDGLDRLIPGPQNPRVQQRVGLAVQ